MKPVYHTFYVGTLKGVGRIRSAFGEPAMVSPDRR